MQDLKRLLDEFPGYTAASDAAFQAGKIYVTLGDSSSAIPMFKRVLNQSDQAQYRLDEAQAWIAHENGNYFKAAQLFAHAVQNAPPEYDTNTSKFMEALNLSHAEMYQDAVKIFIKIAESSDQPIAYSAYANAGIAEIAMGNLNHANIYLMKALESRKPLRGETIYRLYAAEVLYRLEHFTESLEMFDSLNELDLAPSLKSEVNRGIAWNYYSAKQWENAALKFGQYASIYSDSPFRPEALLRQAESYFNAGHYQRAADQFECLINEYPLHPEAFEARLLQARIHWVNEEYEMVRNQLNNALRHAKTSEERQRARMMFGDLEQDLKNYQAASEFFRLAYQDDRRSSEAAHALLKQADNLYNNREFNRAKSVYRQITENFPEAEEAATAQYSIGLIYFQQNRLDDYIDEAYGTARDHPGTVQSALALSGAAELLIDQKRFEDAESILKKLLDQYRDHIDPQQLLFRMAEISHQTGHQDRAISLYNQLLNSYPHGLYTADALFALSEHAHRENRIDDSVSYLQQIIDTFPGHPRLADALKLAGDFARDDNRMDDALNYYTRYLELFPDGKNIFAVSLAIASIHVTHKKCDEARKVLQIAKKSKDRTISSQALFFDARCDAIDGDLDEALKQMLKISYLFSDQRKLVIESLVEAGKILNRQNKLDEMERMFKKAADLAQTDKEQQLVREARKAANQAGGDE